MDPKIEQSPRSVWAFAREPQGLIARRQLLELGYRTDAIKHRIARGRLHPVATGVYAVGRPRLTQHGRWMAAVLSCGGDAALSHESAAALWRITPENRGPIQISVPAGIRRRPGIAAHRRKSLNDEVTRHRGIPVTNPICTLVDLATRLPPSELEAAVNQADKLDRTDPRALRTALDDLPRRPGLKALRDMLDRETFTLTDSELERRFLKLVREAGLPPPQTGQWLNGYKVDFYWPELSLVVETDGLRYHRTPAQQAQDRRRDQAHAAAGLTVLRFTHAQVAFESAYVRATLAKVAQRRHG